MTYDSTPVGQGIAADSQGGWSTAFVVPASASGSHSIGAYGSVTLKASVPNLNFTVTPGISIGRSSGAAGTSVTVTGSGFGAGETGITVTYDGTPVAQGITANSQGAGALPLSCQLQPPVLIASAPTGRLPRQPALLRWALTSDPPSP